MTDNAPAAASAAGAEPLALAPVETPKVTVEAVLAERRQKREETTPAEAAPAGAAPAAETPAGDQPAAEPEGGAETPAVEGEGEGAEPAGKPAVQPPQYWSKEAKAKFAELPPELQAVVAEQEQGGERVRSQAKQAAAEARKAAEKEAGAYRERASRLGELVPQLESALAGKWDGVTPEVWAEVARADASKYAVLKADYDADMAKLGAAKDEHARAESARHDAHLQALVAELPEKAPELSDAKDGPKRLQEVFGYLQSQGIPQESLKWVSAAQLSLAHKAMLYDRGQAALKAPAPRVPKAATPALKPGAPPAVTHTQQQLAALDSKAARSGRMEDVLAARRARRAAKG